MENQKSLLMTSFNNHLFEFLDDIHNVFEKDIAIETTRSALSMIRKTNPKILVTLWHSYVSLPYKQQIDDDHLDFFIEKDYKHDLNYLPYQNEIINHIDRLREPIRNMGKENQMKSFQYIKNLCKLSNLYMNC